MGSFIGAIIGGGLCLWLSLIFVFPDDILNIPLAAMTLGHILRSLGGLFFTLTGGVIGGAIGLGIGVSTDHVKGSEGVAASKERTSKEEMERLSRNWGIPEYRERLKREKEGRTP